MSQALARLEVFYAEKSFIQAKRTGEEQNPGSFQTYKKNESAGGVMGTIQGGIDESMALENEAIVNEQDSQTAYEQITTDSNKGIATKMKGMGKQDAALTMAQGDRKANLADLEPLLSINMNLQDSCNFLMKNYEPRLQAL